MTDYRQSDLAKIHIARKQLGMTDDDYTAMLHTQCGVTSAGALDAAGRKQVLAYLQRQGFRPKARPSAAASRPKRPTPAPERLPLVRRIRAQLISLGRKPDTYADGIAQQMFGAQVQFYEWCDASQLHSISTALGYEQRRQGAHMG